MSYASIPELNRYLEDFATNYYGSLSGTANMGTFVGIATNVLQDDLDASYNKINTYLNSVGHIPLVPIGTSIKTGSYHPYLIEWNCVDTIYTKLTSRHAEEYRDGYPIWMMSFYGRGTSIFQSIVDRKITLDTDTPNRGIGIAQIVSKTGYGSLYTNWDSGYYTRSDFARTYRVKIVGTTDGNEIGQAKYIVSDDDGYSFWSGTFLTGTQWDCSLSSGIEIRFAPGTKTGTKNQLEIGDQWKFDCIPVNTFNSGGEAKFTQFRRG